jgi:putative holliday junction resolvase
MIINYLALDVGTVRIGLATANNVARIATPLMTVTNDEAIIATLRKTISEQGSNELVVGLPRGLDGQETAQTAYVSDFVDLLAAELSLPVHFQDEAATSIKAEAELRTRGKQYEKGDIDMLSAVYILDDYLAEGVH